MIKLVKTCWACPEQYDAYDGNTRVGYLRMRHGCFTVECPGVGEELVYTASPRGDGEFDDDERNYYLRFAVDAIERWRRGEPTFPAAPEVEYEVT